MKYPIEVGEESSEALSYLAAHLKGTILLEYLDPAMLGVECGLLEIVCSPRAPHGQDLRFGFGGRRCDATTWLADEIAAYLRANTLAICMVEDPCARRSDTKLFAQAAGVARFYRDRVLWMIGHDMADSGVVQNALRWYLSGRPEIVAFAKGLTPLSQSAGHSAISRPELRRIARSIVRVVTDIFDEEGYLVWNRR
jgi:hypothetical protein